MTAPTSQELPATAGESCPREAPQPGALSVVEPARLWEGFGWSEIWTYRELLWFFTLRDLQVRYRQTLLGVAWVVLQPLAAMMVFALFFGRFAGTRSGVEGVPYAVFVLAGLVPWTFFASSVNYGTASMTGSSNLLTKTYFPRLIIPFSAIAVSLVEWAIGMVVLGVILLSAGVRPGGEIALLPLFLMALVGTAAGVSCVLAALSVEYRDFRHVLPFLLQLWFFATPILFSPAVVPEAWRIGLSLNPLVGIIDAMRSVVIGTPLDWRSAGVSLVSGFVLFLFGTAFFRTLEHRFGDVA